MPYIGAILDELTLYRIGDILIINISFIELRHMLVDILHVPMTVVIIHSLSHILAKDLHVI